MLHRPPLLVALVGILLASVLNPAAGQQTGTVRGRVTTEDGSPASAVTVTIGERSIRARLDGRFEIEGVPAGERQIVVSGLGLRPISRTITVVAGEVTPVPITLGIAPIEVADITVQGQRLPYRETVTYVASRIPTSLLETPASVDIMNDDRMKDQGASRIDEVFGYMTGIHPSGTRGQGFVLRGFDIDQEFSTYMVDGMTGAVWRQHDPPSAIIERIEYLKGPASVVYGVGQPGGLINIVTKKPRVTPSASIEVRHSAYATDVSAFGAANSYGLTTDFTGPVTTEGDLAYRVILAHMSNESYRTEVNDWSLYIHPSLSWYLSDYTSLTAQLEVTTDKGRWDEYLVAPQNDLSRVPSISTRLGELTDYYWDGGVAATLQLRHAFDERSSLSVNARRVDRADGRRLFQHNRMVNDSILARSYRDQENERIYNFADAHYALELITGPLEHALVVGASGGYEYIHFNRLSLATDTTLNINIYAPVYGAKMPKPKPGFNRVWNNVFVAGYIEDQISIGEMLRITAGARFDQATIDHTVDYDPKRTGFAFKKTDVGVSPRVGLVLLPVEGVSLYGSYSSSFAPTDAEKENAQGTIEFEPTRGRQIEIGTRANLFDGRLSGGVSAYQITQENVLNEVDGKNPNGNTIWAQIGEARSRGLDVELLASPVPGLQITAGYGYCDARITEDPDSALVGARLTYTPFNQANVWLAYRFADGPLKGFGAGFGAVHVGERPTKLPDANGFAFYLPGYTRFDGALYWENDAVKLALNINNVTDVRYWASGESIRLVPGAPMTVRTTISITP